MKRSELLSMLAYIADSPAPEHGGFHPEAIAIAQAALERMKAMKREYQVIWWTDLDGGTSRPFSTLEDAQSYQRLMNQSQIVCGSKIEAREVTPWEEV